MLELLLRTWVYCWKDDETEISTFHYVFNPLQHSSELEIFAKVKKFCLTVSSKLAYKSTFISQKQKFLAVETKKCRKIQILICY